MGRLYWLSLIRTTIVCIGIFGALLGLALLAGTYLLAVIFLILVLFYRRDILDTGPRRFSSTGPPRSAAPSGSSGWHGGSGRLE